MHAAPVHVEIIANVIHLLVVLSMLALVTLKVKIFLCRALYYSTQLH